MTERIPISLRRSPGCAWCGHSGHDLEAKIKELEARCKRLEEAAGEVTERTRQMLPAIGVGSIPSMKLARMVEASIGEFERVLNEMEHGKP